MPVDPRAVRAVQVGQDHPSAVFLNLDVKAAHALVVELDRIVFFAPDGNRSRQVAENSAPLEPLQDLNRNSGHAATSL